MFIMFREINLFDCHRILVCLEFDHLLRIPCNQLNDVVYDEHKVDFDEENLFDTIHN